MLYSTVKFAERKSEKPGYYDIYRVSDDGENATLEISIPAEEIEGVKYGALFAQREDGKYSLYACPSITEDNQEKFGKLRLFIDGIVEFDIRGPFLVYKTNKGIFFLNLTRAFWNIDNDDILEKRRNTIPRIMDWDDKILAMDCFEDKDGKTVACVVWTLDAEFMLFEGEPFCKTDVPKIVYDDEGHQRLNLVPLHGEFLKIGRYEAILGFNHSGKIYPYEEDEFYIGSIISIHECKQPEILYTKIVAQWEAERGMYFAVANKSDEQALIYVKDGRAPRMVTDWSKKSIVMRYQISGQTFFALFEGDDVIQISDDINKG